MKIYAIVATVSACNVALALLSFLIKARPVMHPDLLLAGAWSAAAVGWVVAWSLSRERRGW